MQENHKELINDMFENLIVRLRNELKITPLEKLDEVTACIMALYDYKIQDGNRSERERGDQEITRHINNMLRGCEDHGSDERKREV